MTSRFQYFVLGVLLFLLLGGPTPGSVDGCDRGDPVADAKQHCLNEKVRTIERDYGLGVYGPPGSETAKQAAIAAVNRVPMMCEGAAWPVGCFPTRTQTDACLAGLRNAQRFQDAYAAGCRQTSECPVQECQLTAVCASGLSPLVESNTEGLGALDEDSLQSTNQGNP